MKNFIISLLTVLLVFATSCNEMDQYPHNAVSSDNLTEEDAQLLLTGLYFYIQNKPTVNGYLTQDIVGGDLVRGGATGLKDPVLLVKDLVTPGKRLRQWTVGWILYGSLPSEFTDCRT